MKRTNVMRLAVAAEGFNVFEPFATLFGANVEGNVGNTFISVENNIRAFIQKISNVVISLQNVAISKEDKVILKTLSSVYETERKLFDAIFGHVTVDVSLKNVPTIKLTVGNETISEDCKIVKMASWEKSFNGNLVERVYVDCVDGKGQKFSYFINAKNGQHTWKVEPLISITFGSLSNLELKYLGVSNEKDVWKFKGVK